MEKAEINKSEMKILLAFVLGTLVVLLGSCGMALSFYFNKGLLWWLGVALATLITVPSIFFWIGFFQKRLK